jgi:hypothetical protein
VGVKVRKPWIVVPIIAALLMIAWQRRSFSAEPVYQGKTVTQWLDVMSAAIVSAEPGAEDRGKAEALGAIQAMGTNAIPVLFMHLNAKPRQFAMDVMWERAREAKGVLYRLRRAAGLVERAGYANPMNFESREIERTARVLTSHPR